MWQNSNCNERFINKKDNDITANVTTTVLINCYSNKRKRLLYFAYSFIDYDYIIDSS